MNVSMRWRGVTARAVLLALVAAFIPLPATAADAKSAPNTKTFRASMQDVVAREAAKSAAVRKVRRAQQSEPATHSTSFFKTGPGIAALVVMAAGTGYAIYSASHDRIHSPAKQ